MNGNDSPELYGISLESDWGVMVDNIPMRGSAGTVFTKMDKSLHGKIVKDLNVKLLVLQFGGNVVPYIKDQKACENYGKWFISQIRLLKKMSPDASVIVIGPGDMSKKVKDEYASYPFIEDVRNALKKAAFSEGAAYWDIYEAMGGKNSMLAWVDAEPRLATTDYTHFTHKGARKIAEMFYSALIKDYNEFRANQSSLTKQKTMKKNYDKDEVKLDKSIPKEENKNVKPHPKK